MIAAKLKHIVGQTEKIEKEREAISRSVKSFERSILDSKKELHERTRGPLAKTFASLAEFGEGVVQIVAASGEERRRLISTAKARAAKISAAFGDIHKHANETMKRVDKTKTQIVGLRSRAGGYLGEIQELNQHAEKLKSSADEAIAINQDALETARRDVENSREAKRQAESHKEEQERMRTVRQVLIPLEKPGS